MKDLTPLTQEFILHWGEMGTRWGINRTVAQIHALLFITDRPLHAEEIRETLGVARSNVSNSVRELQNWGIVRVVHLPGDRRDHFESMRDVFEMFRVIAAERKRRELDPTLAMLRKSTAKESSDHAPEKSDDFARSRMAELLEFFELASDFYEQANRLPTQKAVAALRISEKLFKSVGIFKK